MRAEEHRSPGRGGTTVPGQQHGGTERSMDTLAKGLANDALSRGQALKLIGSTLVGAALALLFPTAVAWAEQNGEPKKSTGPKKPGGEGPGTFCPFRPCSPFNPCPSGCNCLPRTVNGKFLVACGTDGVEPRPPR